MRKNPRSHVYLVGTYDCLEGEKVAQDCMAGLLRAHAELKLTTPVTVFISSCGGYVELGLGLQGVVELMRREGRKVIGHVIGFAESSAFDLLQHCSVRLADRWAGLMTHEDQVSSTGSANTSRRADSVNYSRSMEHEQFAIYSQRTGKPIEYYREKVAGREWYMNAQEALDEGLIDAIVEVHPFD